MNSLRLRVLELGEGELDLKVLTQREIEEKSNDFPADSITKECVPGQLPQKLVSYTSTEPSGRIISCGYAQFAILNSTSLFPSLLY
jgi:hypothetical protein